MALYDRKRGDEMIRVFGTTDKTFTSNGHPGQPESDVTEAE